MFALTALCACAGDSGSAVGVTDITDVSEPAAPAEGTGSAEESAAPVADYGHSPKAEVTSCVAYMFEGTEGKTLYGAAEYANTGDCPMTVSGVSMSFGIDGQPYSYSYTPALSEYMVVLPGETSYLAVWLRDESFSSAQTVDLAASVSVAEAASPRVRLEADNIYVADNYPGFSTLSGRISCREGSGCTMNTVYVGFYNAEGGFLGAWYLTKNAVFDAGDSKNFVVNMQDFPIKELGAEAAGFKTSAFGFDLS